MTPAARLSAAIDVMDIIDTQRIPAAQALKDWGTSHRFAGSGDRAAIAGLVWDVLRRRSSSAWIMDADTPRARVLGMLHLERGLDVAAIEKLCDGSRFAPAPLTEAERNALAARSLEAPTMTNGREPNPRASSGSVETFPSPKMMRVAVANSNCMAHQLCGSGKMALNFML